VGSELHTKGALSESRDLLFDILGPFISGTCEAIPLNFFTQIDKYCIMHNGLPPKGRIVRVK